MATLVIYGISSCDTVKNARTWLAGRGVETRFHDFKRDGVPADRLDAWLAALGWEAVLNRKGTTWRKADDATRARVVDRESAGGFLHANPSAIRRPVVEWGESGISVGFDAAEWEHKR